MYKGATFALLPVRTGNNAATATFARQQKKPS
jgi:hypothetical protein